MGFSLQQPQKQWGRRGVVRLFQKNFPGAPGTGLNCVRPRFQHCEQRSGGERVSFNHTQFHRTRKSGQTVAAMTIPGQTN